MIEYNDEREYVHLVWVSLFDDTRFIDLLSDELGQFEGITGVVNCMELQASGKRPGGKAEMKVFNFRSVRREIANYRPRFQVPPLQRADPDAPDGCYLTQERVYIVSDLY